jgi:hypothetical protein
MDDFRQSPHFFFFQIVHPENLYDEADAVSASNSSLRTRRGGGGVRITATVVA